MYIAEDVLSSLEEGNVESTGFNNGVVLYDPDVPLFNTLDALS